MPSYSFTDTEIEHPEGITTGEQLAQAMKLFRQHGVQNGYISIDGSELKKVVDGKIVEMLQPEEGGKRNDQYQRL